MVVNKYANNAKLLVKIGSIILLCFGSLFLLISMFIPVEMTIGDSTVSATIWEFAKYPAHLTFLICVVFFSFS